MLFLPSFCLALVGKFSRSDLTLASPLLVKCSALKDKYVLSTGVCKLRTLNVSSPRAGEVTISTITVIHAGPWEMPSQCLKFH